MGQIRCSDSGERKEGSWSQEINSRVRRELVFVDDLTLQSAEHELYGVTACGHHSLTVIYRTYTKSNTRHWRCLALFNIADWSFAAGGRPADGRSAECQPIRQPALSHECPIGVNRGCLFRRHPEPRFCGLGLEARFLMGSRPRCQSSKIGPLQRTRETSCLIPG
jgi:hypothetical protein